MDDYTSAAKGLAESIRYAGDSLRPSGDPEAYAFAHAFGGIYHNDLKISSSVTPGLADRLRTVCSRLFLPIEFVSAFVYASPEIQAECYSGPENSCALRFSSSLVDLLNDEEFMFVVGHEVGHYLLGHGSIRASHRSDSVEFFIQQRAQEISSDRLGLIACESLDVAMHAMMKTVSGLGAEHLRFDVNAFIKQLKDTPHGAVSYSASHPSIFVRCKALLWFSLNDAYVRGSNEYAHEDLVRLDQHIKNDIDKYVDGPARKKIAEAESTLFLWSIANHVVQDGVLNKEEQAVISKLVGEDDLKRLKGFLSDMPAAEIQDEVLLRLNAAREDLERMAPSSFEAMCNGIQKKISNAFRE